MILRASRASEVAMQAVELSRVSSGDSSRRTSTNAPPPNPDQLAVDPALLSQLTEMGFKPSLSKLALVLNESVVCCSIVCSTLTLSLLSC